MRRELLKVLRYWKIRAAVVVLLLAVAIWLMVLDNWWWIVTSWSASVVLAWLVVDAMEGRWTSKT
jgi:hypothetical protein